MNARRKKFVQEYLKDLNATQAAIRAGYSAATADRQGSRLLGFVEIAEAVEKAQQERSERTQVTVDRVVEELARLGFSNMRDVAGWNEDGMHWKGSNEISDDAAATIKDVTVHREVRKDRNGDEITTINTKMSFHDKKGSLELLGRHLGMFKDNLNVGIRGPVRIRVKGTGTPPDA